MPQKIIKNGIFFSVTLCLWGGATSVWAELHPVTDSELSEITGQAYISIDKTFHPEQTNLSYTRINLGMDIDTKMNVDALELGRYDRAGERSGTSDVLINNFGLGYINNAQFFSKYPYIPSVEKPGGGSYGEGEIVPFHISDPYLEFAYDENTGQMIGVRIGFGQAMGLMTGDIQTLTGNVDVDIRDNGSGIRAASSEQGNLSDQLVIGLTPFLAGNNAVQAQALLVNQQGELDPVRAEYIGMPNGSEFKVNDLNLLTTGLMWLLSPTYSSQVRFEKDCSFFICWTYDAYIESQNCLMLGVQTCFDLGNFQTLPIGEVEKKNGKPVVTAPVSGMFLSFQTKDTPWSKTRNSTDAATAADYVDATSGAFFNIPNGSVEVNLYEVYKGTPAVRQEFIDRGRGLF